MCPDRVVDDLNPVLTFTRKEVESLLHFAEEEPDPTKAPPQPHKEMETVISQACQLYPHLITKVHTLTLSHRHTLSFIAVHHYYGTRAID